MLLAAAAAMFASCEDNEVIATNDDMPEVAYMSFKVMASPSVDLTGNATRGVDTDYQNSVPSPDSRIGLFVLHEDDYAEKTFGTQGNNITVTAPSVMDKVWMSGNTSLTSAYADSVHYGCSNEEVRVNADGTISRTDANQFIYPFSSDTEKAAIIAISPRIDDMTYNDLFGSVTITVDADQSNDEVMYKNDIMVGVPSINNPFRTTSGPVDIVFSHVMTKIRVNVTIPRRQAFFCDSIQIDVDGLLTKATLKPYDVAKELDATESKAPAETASQMLVNALDGSGQTVRMYDGGGIAEAVADAPLLISCCAYVPAQTFSEARYPTVKIRLINKEHIDENGTTIPESAIAYLFSDKSYSPYRSGTNKVYNITVEE